MKMEITNETAVVGLVPRAVALALAFVATTIITAGVAVVFTAPGENVSVAHVAVAPIEGFVKTLAR
jgi:hypothetical protein